MINTEPYKTARNLAIKYHDNQKYGKTVPYVFHLDDVFTVLLSFNVTDESILLASFLHDSIEDTTLTYTEIKKLFGFETAELVYAVTDELGRNRKESHIKTFPKLKCNQNAIILKLADRISNVKFSLKNNNFDKYNMYQKEYQEFRNELYNHCSVKGLEMFSFLDSLMNYNYKE